MCWNARILGQRAAPAPLPKPVRQVLIGHIACLQRMSESLPLEQRLELIQILCALPEVQFEQLCFALQPLAGLVPSKILTAVICRFHDPST